jgi:hypothetical protein
MDIRKSPLYGSSRITMENECRMLRSMNVPSELIHFETKNDRRYLFILRRRLHFGLPRMT